ncbi:MAG: endolytic transglycosylase MltG [Tetrasphaera sp.]|jgi:UPF0755 protein|nr:endolytic transglycosylase MltG [Tetrasphaera sp.]
MRQQLEEEIFGTGQAGGSAPAEPNRRAMHSFAALVLSLSVLVGGGFAAYHFIGPAIEKFVATDDYPGPGTGSVTFEVQEGASGTQIAAGLVKAGIIKSTSAFISASSAAPDQAKAIQPGSYTMKKEMTAKDALAYLSDPTHRSVKRVTIPEGLWASEIYQRLSKASGIPIKDYQTAAKETKALGLPSAAKGNVEGWLFPSTYEFEKKSTAAEQLTIMVAQTVKVLSDEGIAKDKWESTMILASIVESEAGSDKDRPKVARVFLNRIADPTGETIGRLYSDATVSYGAGRRAVSPTQAELADAENKYNTYLYAGLTPGPISNPGKASIDAASHPATGDWLYFVTVNPSTGETKFAKTNAEFLVYKAEFTAWCKKHPEAKCFG